MYEIKWVEKSQPWRIPICDGEEQSDSFSWVKFAERANELEAELLKWKDGWLLKDLCNALESQRRVGTSTNSASKKCFGCSNYLPSCQHTLIPDSIDCKRNFEAYP